MPLVFVVVQNGEATFLVVKFLKDQVHVGTLCSDRIYRYCRIFLKYGLFVRVQRTVLFVRVLAVQKKEGTVL